LLSVFGAYATHTPYVQIDVRSRAEKSPFHLRTEAWQLIGTDISRSTAGVHGWAHSRFCRGLSELLREKLPVIQPDDALKDEIVERLRAITDRGFEGEKQIADPATKLLT